MYYMSIPLPAWPYCTVFSAGEIYTPLYQWRYYYSQLSAVVMCSPLHSNIRALLFQHASSRNDYKSYYDTVIGGIGTLYVQQAQVACFQKFYKY